jgi:ABC-2 type transport system ATP-binding protein
MLLGLIAPSAGRIELLGRRLPDPRAVARAGSMIEEPAFYPWMTGRQNLQVLAATGGGCTASEVTRVLSLAGLGDVAARKVKGLFPGHAAVARHSRGDPWPPAIADHRRADQWARPRGHQGIRQLLRDLAADGTTVFLSSHLLAEVEQVCDRVAVIVRGRLVDEGAPATLGAIRRRVRVGVDAADTGAAGRLLARWPARRMHGGFLVEHDSGREVNCALVQGGVIAESVTVEQPRLEDRFLEITQKENAHAVAAES